MSSSGKGLSQEPRHPPAGGHESFTRSSQNVVPESTTWGVPDFPMKGQRVHVLGFGAMRPYTLSDTTTQLCHDYERSHTQHVSEREWSRPQAV